MKPCEDNGDSLRKCLLPPYFGIKCLAVHEATRSMRPLGGASYVPHTTPDKENGAKKMGHRQRKWDIVLLSPNAVGKVRCPIAFSASATPWISPSPQNRKGDATLFRTITALFLKKELRPFSSSKKELRPLFFPFLVP